MKKERFSYSSNSQEENGKIFFKNWTNSTNERYFDEVIKSLLNIQLKEYEKLQYLIIENLVNKDLTFDNLKEFVFSKSVLNITKSADFELTGIDIPIWLKGNCKTGNRVIIVAQDPKRNEKSFKKFSADIKEQLIVWTPFSYQEKNNSVNVYWKIIDEIVSKSSMVYITDLNKIWYNNKKIDKSISNELFNLYFEILQKEINEFVKPDIIIAFGKKALCALCELDINVKPIYFPHPSKNNTHKESYFQKKIGKDVYDIIKKNEDSLFSLYQKLIENYFNQV